MSAKRASESGSSPVQKKMEFDNALNEDAEVDWPGSSPGTQVLYLPPTNYTPPHKSPGTLSEQSSSQIPSLPDIPLFQSQPSISSYTSAPPSSCSPGPPLPFFPSQPNISSQTSSSSAGEPLLDLSFNPGQCINIDESFTSDIPDFLTDFQFIENLKYPGEDSFVEALETSKDSIGAAKAAELILEDNDLKEEITRLILAKTHQELKQSLKNSILSANKKDRRYLLSLSPRVLCQELRDLAPDTYRVLLTGLLGVSDLDNVLDNHHLSNVLAMLISTIAKTLNRKSTGYGLLLTTICRDGGLREDSMKLLCNLCHVRTAQKYDKEVLAQGWDNSLKEALDSESLRFQELRNAEIEADQIPEETSSEATSSAAAAAATEIELLRNELPPQIQLVWDNLNLRSKHRFERQRDNWSDSNYDWMASLWIQERISANHMEHKPGESLKEPFNLSIQDFIPSQKEEDYLFSGLVHYYAHRLTKRHPLVFKSLNSSMEVKYLATENKEMIKHKKANTLGFSLELARIMLG